MFDKTLRDINGKHLAIIARAVGNHHGEESGSSAHVSDGHAVFKFKRLDDLLPVLKDCAAFTFKHDSVPLGVGVLEIVVDARLDALFLRGSDAAHDEPYNRRAYRKTISNGHGNTPGA